MKIQRKITLIRHKMRQVWSSSGEQNLVKQDSECAVYLTSIQLDQQTVARANYRLSTPELLQQITCTHSRTVLCLEGVAQQLRIQHKF